MRLLLITQKVDRRDPILGFFHRWIAEFARQCERVIAVGQFVGEHHLPANVDVRSLGKEHGSPTWRQVLACLGILWREREHYDAVFVHMTPIWVVLTSPLLVLLRKPIYLWYEARGARWPLRLALLVVRHSFSASEHGMPIASQRNIIVGHGIDTERFTPGSPEMREDHLLLTVGRITRAKNLDLILGALRELPAGYRLMIAGVPITPEDRALQSELYEFLHGSNLADRVTIRPVSQDEVVDLLQHAVIFVHASSTSLDKAVLEAMACGCIVVSTAQAVHPILPTLCRATEQDLADRIREVAGLPEDRKAELASVMREEVVQNHRLDRLIERLVSVMRS